MTDADCEDDTDIDEEEEMIARRLVAIQHLRRETHRLKSEGRAALASGVSIPAGWRDLLGQGLAWAIEEDQEEHAEGKLSDRELHERVERARSLAEAIGSIEPDGTYSVAPAHQGVLYLGLCQSLDIQTLARHRVTEHDPLGLRFITAHSEHALGDFVWELGDLLEEDEEEP